MLQISRLSLSYGAQAVLDDVSLVLNAGEHAGLTGPNGCGKSTLLRCAAGLLRPDRGNIALAPRVRAGFLGQEQAWPAGMTVGRALAAAGEAGDAQGRLEAAAAALGNGGEGALVEYEAALTSLQDAASGAGPAAIAERLGLANIPSHTPLANLSGGQKTRLALACLLASAPGVLLLDEPTNHLDIDALEWLEEFLRGFRGAVLVVSHDREFLDRVTTATFAIDGRTHTLRRFNGNYSASVETREAEAEQQLRQWKVQQEYVARVESDIARLKGEALNIERNTTPREPGVRRHARRKAAVAKSREHKLERFLESDEHVARPLHGWALKVDFGGAGASGREAVRIRDMNFAYGDGPAVLSGVSLDIQHGERLAVAGPNGTGKTTLLRLIDGRLSPTAGEVWRSPSLRIATLTQELETLDGGLTVLETLRRARRSTETAARNFLHLYLFAGDAPLRLVGLCSPGERARLQLALAVARGASMLVLDEPLNHLDIESREQFEAALTAFDGAIVAVSHDRRFLARFAERTALVADGTVRVIEGGLPDKRQGKGRGKGQ